MKTTILDLPPEIIMRISNYLSFLEQKNFFYVHKYFSFCLRKNQVLKITSTSTWRRIYTRLPFYKTIIFNEYNSSKFFPIDEDYHIIKFNLKK